MIRMSKTLSNGDLAVINFDYSESCHNVYKHFSVERNDKKSTLTWLKKYLKDTIPSIISANTYFWHSSSTARSRRYNEEKRENEVKDFFLENGFTEYKDK